MARTILAAAAAAAIILPIGAAAVLSSVPAPATGPAKGAEAAGPATAAPSSPAPPPATPKMSAADAARLADQASFGPTPALMSTLTAGGADAWLTAQFAAKSSSYVDLGARAVPTNQCAAIKTNPAAQICARDYFSQIPVAMRFYADAAGGDDQLRQRVAYALSEIVVASENEVHSTAGLATFEQIFVDHAFGNYRDILKAATLSPFMGAFLNMAGSNKASPNENYARELMQLFSLGLNELNPDGTAMTDAHGATIANFTGADVHDVARALTGWTYARLPNTAANDGFALDYSRPMAMVPAAYDATAKHFLGRTVPAGATQAESVDAVVDAVFENASTAPFVSKQLIQQLVTSNPSAAYVRRVSAVFVNDGAGVRGDLKAVVRAVLTDPEARGALATSATDGKVKEPVLLLVNLFRAVGGTSDGYAFTQRDGALGQQPFRAPSVFNFYPPDYPLPHGGALVSPPSKLISTNTIISRHNFAYDWTLGGQPTRAEFKAQASIPGATGTTLNWAAWEGLSPAAVLDRINLLFFNQTMTAAQRAALTTAMTAIVDKDPVAQARLRVQTALYVAGSSPQYQVSR